MTCNYCKQSSSWLKSGMCFSCTAIALDRLTSACQHLVQNWRDAKPELEDRFAATAPLRTNLATETLIACANRLETIITKCSTP